MTSTPPSRPAASYRLGRPFVALWAASTLSNLGDGVALIAAPFLAATLTHDPTLVAGLALTQRLPWLLFALPSGAFADRLDRRRGMAIAGGLRALLIGLLGLAVVMGWASLPMLYVIIFLLSTAETFFDTAAATLLPAIVPRDDLPAANARLAGTVTLTNQFIGPPLGGLLFATAAALPFLLGAGGLAAAAALILALPRAVRGAPRAAPPALRAAIREGVRWLWNHRLLRTIALVMAVLNILVVAQVSIMVLVARDRLGLSPAGYGVLVSTYGVGGVLGSVIAARVIQRLGAGRVLRLALVIEAVTPAVIAATHRPLLVGATLLVFGGHAVVWGSLLSALRQELTPDGLRGRVESVYRLIEYGGAAPGAVLGGVLATQWGLTAPFWLGAGIGGVLLVLTWSAFSDATVARARAAGTAGGERLGNAARTEGNRAA